MNKLLELKGRMLSRRNKPGPAIVSFPSGKTISHSHLMSLKRQLSSVYEYWNGHSEIGGTLVSVHYTKVISKSSRIRTLLEYRSSPPSDHICGAKFEMGQDKTGEKVPKHVFTLFLPIEAVHKAVSELEVAAQVYESQWGKGEVDAEQVDKLQKDGFAKKLPSGCRMSKSHFVGIVVDAVYVERFDVDKRTEEFKADQLISVYDTGMKLSALLDKFGISINPDRIYNDTTAYLSDVQANLLLKKAPYIISMSQVDFRKLAEEMSAEVDDQSAKKIPSPQTEPIVGVIDTHFDEGVYFSEWVDYRNMMPNEELLPEDYFHGTSVDSIIVDGPRGNPWLEDHCGHFKVRHFGVSRQSGFQSYKMLKLVREIVRDNRDIRVWNLSLGTEDEVDRNFISPVAAELDRLQREEGVVFVIAGTNIPPGKGRNDMRIGSPADSLNAIVVNSVAADKRPASYTRTGPVLSFFHKPDICYYGGDSLSRGGGIIVCGKAGGVAMQVAGTSFAAPWITRKMAFLIHVMGLSAQVAKALLIDSAARWEPRRDVNRIGYGLVPISIRKVLETEPKEIRFFIHGTADEYETYTYELPIPLDGSVYPFYVRATLAYFPYGNRNNGVDYTNTEMDVHVGRVTLNKKGNVCIRSIDNNKQDDEGHHTIYEIDARNIYRKWDNVKHIVEEIKSRPVPRKILGRSKLWGISIKAKERSQGGARDKLGYGLVITLQEMFGRDRYADFMRLCAAAGWIVNEVEIEARVRAYFEAANEIEI